MTERQPERGTGEEQRTQQTQSMSQAAANNTNNSQRHVNQEPESAVFCLASTPEVLVKVYTTNNQVPLKATTPHQVYAPCGTPSFPLYHVYAPLHLGFPQMIQLGNRKNSGDAVPHISITMTRRNPALASSSPVAMATQEFPIIKKQFVSFPNYRTVANEDGPKTTPATTTVTQRGTARDTEIDGGGGSVHKVFDNEPEAERRATTTKAAALNLNVVEAVAKEIEHQQAENLNDAFGQRHDHKGRVSDDAMDVDVAKNKREICEQSKLEKAEDHNELNMTENLADQEQQQQQQQRRQRQSICLAREQTIDGDGYGYGYGNGNHQWQLSGDLSATDARESSPEQVDVNNLGRQQLTRERNRTQNRYRNPCPNIELLKSSVRAFLADSSPIDWDWDCDWELLELLTNAIELLCAAPADTGNFWSEEAVQAEADMTVSKVSEERETETVDVYPAAVEQLEQPLDLESELDNNNNNSSSSSIPVIITEPIDMKYSTSTASRIPRAELSQPVIQPSSRPSATSRVRDVTDVQPTSRTTTTPLLGELKRSSTEASSIDTDSVLPERTRLRRQRRMRSQDSVEEKPEDVIERINKLKARISGALSEVKGVLKQYSTESEAEAGSQELPKPSTKPPLAAAEPAPVAFRFVTKVRRRSYFDEAEEEKEQAASAKDNENQSNQGHLSVPQRDTKVKREQTPFAFPDKKEASPNLETKGKESQNIRVKVGLQEKDCQGSKEHQESETTVDGQVKSKEFKEVKKDSAESFERIKEEKYPEKDEKEILKSNLQEEPPKVNGELPRTDLDMGKLPEKSKSQTKIEFLAKVQSELKSKSVREASRRDASPKETITKERTREDSVSKDVVTKELKPNEVKSREASPKETTPKEAASKEAATPKKAELKDVASKKLASKEASPKEKSPKEETPKEATSHKPAKIKPELVVTPANDAGPQPDESSVEQPMPKIKKKVIVKAKNPRRASIAAVEPSKIKVEPAVEQIDALIIQRRPSDSEAIVKRKKKLKLMSAAASPTESPPAAAAVKSTTTSGNQREATPSIAEEQLATPEVTSVAAKSASAKSDQGEATTEVVTTTASTPTEAIDVDPAINGNLAPAGNRSRRASLKLAELVGETVLVVPAAPHPVPATEALPPTESKEPINQETQLQVQAAPQQVAIAADIAPQIATTLRQEESSPEQQQPAEAVEATKVGEQAPPGDSLATMPELKVLAGPVQPVKIETVEQPHDEAKGQEPLVKKKAPTHLKKLVRKNSIDKKDEAKQDQKQQDSNKLSNILRDKNKINELSSRINKLTPPKKQAVKPKEEEKKIANEEQKEEQQLTEEAPAEEAPLEIEEPETEPAPEPEPAPKPKKPRKIKKKVIIKRQKRRLSIGDTFFLQPEPEEPTIPEIETIEKAIAYVTDDEEEEEEQPPQEEPSKALKSCMHVREYKIGDLVLYAERFRKTQVRWKRGRVLEQITSISYKLEIEGKEVPAHVSYIKKYTGRKVRFGGKEYLEIDYEQVAEEERRAASYSIWNMV
nr:microtubule-associated protein futsch [Drosophila kikkawai]